MADGVADPVPEAQHRERHRDARRALRPEGEPCRPQPHERRGDRSGHARAEPPHEPLARLHKHHPYQRLSQALRGTHYIDRFNGEASVHY